MALGNSGITDAFKRQLLLGSFGDLSSTTLRVALIKLNSELDTANSNTSTHPTTADMNLYGDLSANGAFEVNEAGNYQQNDTFNNLSGNAVTLSNNTAILDFSDKIFSNVTLSTRGALIYKHDSNAANRHTVALINFGGDITANSGNLTLTFPDATSSTGFIRLV